MLTACAVFAALDSLGLLLLFAVTVALYYLTNEKLMHFQKQLNELTTHANNSSAAAKSAADLAQRAIELVPSLRPAPVDLISNPPVWTVTSPKPEGWQQAVYSGEVSE